MVCPAVVGVLLDGRSNVNIVNYAKGPVSSELPKGKWRDQIARQNIEGIPATCQQHPCVDRAAVKGPDERIPSCTRVYWIMARQE
jgi:hypothetical protein